MKNLYLILIASLFTVVVAAQEINCTAKKTSSFEDDYKNSAIVSVGDDGKGGFTVVRFNEVNNSLKPFKYSFEHFNDKMVKVKSFEQKMEGMDRLLDVQIRKETVTMIEFEYDKDINAYVCYANSASINDFKFNNRRELFKLAVKRDNTTVVTSPFSEAKSDDYYANLIRNSDGSLFAIRVDVNAGDGKEKGEVHNVYVFNDKFELQWQNSYKSGYDKKDYTREGFDLTEDGSAAYLLGRVEQRGKARRKDGATYNFELTRVDKTQAKSKTFDTGGKYTDDLEVIVKKNGVACVGFYSEEGGEFSKGICYHGFDSATLEGGAPKFTPFTKEFSGRFQKTDKVDEIKGLFLLKGIFLTPNDDIILNAENCFQDYKVKYSKDINDLRFYYQGILSARLGSNGDVLWTESAFKAQTTHIARARSVSYVVMPVGEDVYCFANGIIEDFKGEPYLTFKNAVTSDLNAVKFDKNGKVTVKKIMPQSDIPLPLWINCSKALPESSSVYLLGGEDGKKMYTKITL